MALSGWHPLSTGWLWLGVAGCILYSLARTGGYLRLRNIRTIGVRGVFYVAGGVFCANG